MTPSLPEFLVRPPSVPTPAPGIINREHWLTELALRSLPLFRTLRLPPHRLTCGWPTAGGLSARRRVIGQCHPAESSRAGVFELFISPLLDDPLAVAGTVLHEMAHVAAGVKAGHGREFVKVCNYVGLTKGRPTQVGPGDELTEKIRPILEALGPYPHSAVEPKRRDAARKAPPLRLLCPACGCKLTMEVRWLAEAGLPTCGCGTPVGVVNGRILGEGAG